MANYCTDNMALPDRTLCAVVIIVMFSYMCYDLWITLCLYVVYVCLHLHYQCNCTKVPNNICALSEPLTVPFTLVASGPESTTGESVTSGVRSGIPQS